MEREKIHASYWCGNLKEVNRLEDLNAYVKIRTGLSVKWNGRNMWRSCGTIICAIRGLFPVASDLKNWVHLSGYGPNAWLSAPMGSHVGLYNECSQGHSFIYFNQDSRFSPKWRFTLNSCEKSVVVGRVGTNLSVKILPPSSGWTYSENGDNIYDDTS